MSMNVEKADEMSSRDGNKAGCLRHYYVYGVPASKPYHMSRIAARLPYPALRLVERPMRRNGSEYSTEETAKRYRAILRGALHTPPSPLKEMPRQRRARKRKAGEKAS